MKLSSISVALILAPFAAALLLPNCAAPKAGSQNADPDLDTLSAWMTGDFSSQAQSQRDSDFFDIRLHIRPIWPADRTNRWLYVEQATAAAETKPYRQRVYRLEREGAIFKSIVYTLPEPERWVGAWKTPGLFDQLNPEALSLREGCTVFLEKISDQEFRGATRGQGCESTLRGAKYASSTVTLSARELVSWDQGFNEKGEQVWGAVKGGYVFVKQ